MTLLRKLLNVGPGEGSPCALGALKTRIRMHGAFTRAVVVADADHHGSTCSRFGGWTDTRSRRARPLASLRSGKESR